MKKLTLALMVALLPATTMAASSNEKSYSIELSNPDKPMSLEVEMHTGSVTVEGYNGKTVEILAKFSPLGQDDLKRIQEKQRKRDKGKEDKKKRDMTGLKSVENVSMSLEIEEDENEVEISSELGTKKVDLIVKVPFSASLDIELYKGGDVNISNVSGEIEAEAYRGHIYAKNISGPIVAETHSTDIVVTFATLNKANPSSITTYSGDIDVSLSNKVAAEVQVQNYQGEIFSGLTEAFKATESIKQNKKKGGRQEIKVGGLVSAKVKGGGQSLSLITYSGDVYVRKH